jgi:hypothetical protein
LPPTPANTMVERTVSSVLSFWASWGALIVGAAYFCGSPKSVGIRQRLLVSAYSPATALLFAAAMLVPLESWLALGRPAFLWLQLIPAVLAVYCVAQFQGPRWFHSVLVPVALVCWLWQAAYGYITIYGK